MVRSRSERLSGSSCVAQLFTHIHFVRLVFVLEDAPEFAIPLPEEEWLLELDPKRIAAMLELSARVVRDAVLGRRERSSRDGFTLWLFLQHMIRREGDHHGRIKLSLKIAGRAISDDDVGAETWGVWMSKNWKSNG